MIRIYVDGNLHEVCCMVEGQRPELAKLDGTNTNNVAEYRAVLFGLYKHPEAAEVVSDSQLVVKQLSGEYAVKSQGLLPYWLKVKTRVEKLGHEVKFIWVSKEDNPAGRVLK